MPAAPYRLVMTIVRPASTLLGISRLVRHDAEPRLHIMSNSLEPETTSCSLRLLPAAPGFGQGEARRERMAVWYRRGRAVIGKSCACALSMLIVFVVACAENPPRVAGGVWRSWDIDRREGENAGEEVISISIKPTRANRVDHYKEHTRLVVHCNSASPEFEMSFKIGSPGQPIDVMTWFDGDTSDVRERTWLVGPDGWRVLAPPEFLEEMLGPHTRLDVRLYSPDSFPQTVIFSLANFSYLHPRFCKTNLKYQYYN